MPRVVGGGVRRQPQWGSCERRRWGGRVGCRRCSRVPPLGPRAPEKGRTRGRGREPPGGARPGGREKETEREKEREAPAHPKPQRDQDGTRWNKTASMGGQAKLTREGRTPLAPGQSGVVAAANRRLPLTTRRPRQPPRRPGPAGREREREREKERERERETRCRAALAPGGALARAGAAVQCRAGGCLPRPASPVRRCHWAFGVLNFGLVGPGLLRTGVRRTRWCGG